MLSYPFYPAAVDRLWRMAPLSRGYLPLFIEFPRTWSFEVQIVIIFCIKYLSYFVSNHHHICIKWCLEDISHYLWISHAHDHLKYHQVPSNKNELMRGMGNKSKRAEKLTNWLTGYVNTNFCLRFLRISGQEYWLSRILVFPQNICLRI